VPDPPPHAPQLALGNVLASVAGLPGSSIKLLDGVVFGRWVTPLDAEVDLLRPSGLN